MVSLSILSIMNTVRRYYYLFTSFAFLLQVTKTHTTYIIHATYSNIGTPGWIAVCMSSAVCTTASLATSFNGHIAGIYMSERVSPKFLTKKEFSNCWIEIQQLLNSLLNSIQQLLNSVKLLNSLLNSVKLLNSVVLKFSSLLNSVLNSEIPVQSCQIKHGCGWCRW